jgi:hypothetical protein
MNGRVVDDLVHGCLGDQIGRADEYFLVLWPHTPPGDEQVFRQGPGCLVAPCRLVYPRLSQRYCCRSRCFHHVHGIKQASMAPFLKSRQSTQKLSDKQKDSEKQICVTWEETDCLWLFFQYQRISLPHFTEILKKIGTGNSPISVIPAFDHFSRKPVRIFSIPFAFHK